MTSILISVVAEVYVFLILRIKFILEGPFMGRMMGSPRTHWGNKILGTVDSEVERLVNGSYNQAKEVLERNLPLLHHLAKTLVEQEIVSTEEFQMMLIEFNTKTAEFKILGSERRREMLPFKYLPTDYSI